MTPEREAPDWMADHLVVTQIITTESVRRSAEHQRAVEERRRSNAAGAHVKHQPRQKGKRHWLEQDQ